MLRVLLKICFICLFAGLVLGLGLVLGPEKRNAQALVFDRLVSYVRATPEYLFDDKAFSGPRKVVVNNNTTWLSVGRTTDSVSSVLDFYSDQFSNQPVSTIDLDMADLTDDSDIKSVIGMTYLYSHAMRPLRHYRVEGRDYGFLGVFDFLDKDLELGSGKSMDLLIEALETGEIGKLGIARAIIAIRRPETENTQVINIWTDRDFNLENLVPDASGDVPGFDVPDVPRPPGSSRIYSLTQTNLNTLDSVILYKGEGSVSRVAMFYPSQMEQHGWTRYSEMDRFAKSAGNPATMFFMKDDRECMISINKDPDSNGVLTTITERRGRQS